MTTYVFFFCSFLNYKKIVLFTLLLSVLYLFVMIFTTFASTIISFLKFVSSPDMILCGWLGSKHQLTIISFVIITCSVMSEKMPTLRFATPDQSGSTGCLKIFAGLFLVSVYHCSSPSHPPPPPAKFLLWNELILHFLAYLPMAQCLESSVAYPGQFHTTSKSEVVCLMTFLGEK